jgi:lipopolysaccharide transport system ATP-binding protein
MSSERIAPQTLSAQPALSVSGLGKCYHIYDKPQHRLLQGLLRGRRKFHRDFWALRNISFDVHRGETIGVIGPNGSGKSTLLQLACGTLNPTEGTVRTNGKIGALLELGSGFNPEFTGRENVYLNASLLGLSQARIDERFASIAEFADIGQFMDQSVKTYSSGMFVRLAFAVIAHTDADVLIIDEALAVGDALFTQKCMRFLHAFRARGTIFFVSHDTGAVLNLCDKAMWLQNGEMVSFGDAKSVVEGYVQWNLEQLQGAAARSASAREPEVERSGTPTTDKQPTPGSASAATEDDLHQAPETESTAIREGGFGQGGATIEYVGLHRREGRRIHAVNGGEPVTLRIAARATTEVLGPIIGFHFKDRLGQIVFGDNSFLSTAGAPLTMKRDEVVVASFDFDMPHMKTGEYLFDVAFAEGTQAMHVQHHWVFDALVVHVIAELPVFGILSIPCSVSVRKGRTLAGDAAPPATEAADTVAAASAPGHAADGR